MRERVCLWRVFMKGIKVVSRSWFERVCERALRGSLRGGVRGG